MNRASNIYAGDAGGTDPDGNPIANPSRVIAPDIHRANWLVGLIATALSGNPSVTVEYTDDDVLAVGYDPAAASSTWVKHPTINASSPVAGTPVSGNLVVPVRGIRLRCTGGNARLQVLQSG